MDRIKQVKRTSWSVILQPSPADGRGAHHGQKLNRKLCSYVRTVHVCVQNMCVFSHYYSTCVCMCARACVSACTHVCDIAAAPFGPTVFYPKRGGGAGLWLIYIVD